MFFLPKTILQDSTRDMLSWANGDSTSHRLKELLWEDDTAENPTPELEESVKVIVEYVTASNWSASFDYFRTAMYNVRTAPPTQSSSAQTFVPPSDEERGALVMLRLLSAFWVDGQKLALVIQELCASFLHFRKPFQNTVAVDAPLLITRWVDRHPGPVRAAAHAAAESLRRGRHALRYGTDGGGQRPPQGHPLPAADNTAIPAARRVRGGGQPTRGQGQQHLQEGGLPRRP